MNKVNLYTLLFENTTTNKKLLLLVHPDTVFETNNKFATDYFQTLKQEIGNFDAVITHLMFSDRAPKALSWDDEKTSLFLEFREFLKQNSIFIGLDKQFSISFDDAMPSYLIENEGTQIHLAGGYKDLCVKETYKKLLLNLSDIISETQATISCYGPLLITDRHKPSLDNDLTWKHDGEKESWSSSLNKL